MDELAAAAHEDPVRFRLAYLKNPRQRAVLELAAERAGWGTPLPAHSGRGVSVQNAFGSFLAQVVEVRVTGEDQVRVERVVCAMDCGQVVNPDGVRAQLEGGATSACPPCSATRSPSPTDACSKATSTRFSVITHAGCSARRGPSGVEHGESRW